MKNKLGFIGCVLAIGIIQQLGRPRTCSVCCLPVPTLISLQTSLTAHNDAELRSAVGQLKANSVLKIAPGTYRGGLEVRGIQGLTIEAAEPNNPPQFVGGGNAWHFAGCSQLTVRRLTMKAQTGNGINIDDGGRAEPTKNIRLEGLHIEDIGPSGNHDAIKLSGIDELAIVDCTIRGWGGQGIDMVGCHHGLVDKCRFEGKAGFTATAGVQTKGGSSDIVIENCQFIDAGERPLNIGGSTGMDYFRPKDAPYEAARITARRNRIEGGLCSAAFVGVDGGEFTENTILYPKKWVFRILQETNGERFVPCRGIKIKDNRIAIRRSEVQIECNVGGGTDAASFEFRGNQWYAADRPDRSRPKLPSEESGGQYGIDWAKPK